jgi:hypothetical protein
MESQQDRQQHTDARRVSSHRSGWPRTWPYRLCWSLMPWWVLMAAAWDAVWLDGVAQQRARVKYWRAIARIDFAAVYSTMNDLIW